MKVLAYILGIPAYILASIIVIPFSIGLKYLYAKLYNTIDIIYLGLINGWLISIFFLIFMHNIFQWFGSKIPISFIIVVSLSVLLNDYKRITSRPLKGLEGGYLIGDMTGLIGIYWQWYDDGFIWF